MQFPRTHLYLQIMRNAQIQIYTGDGKGKTTAALGVALRVLGCGGSVYFGQFIKGPKLSSEFKALEIFGSRFVHAAFGAGRFIKGAPSKRDVELARQGLTAASEALASGDYDLVVLDEINGAVTCGLLMIDDALEAIDKRHPETELIITGRGAPAKIAEIADLISEITSVKHYFDKGIPARKGIEF